MKAQKAGGGGGGEGGGHNEKGLWECVGVCGGLIRLARDVCVCVCVCVCACVSVEGRKKLYMHCVIKC